MSQTKEMSTEPPAFPGRATASRAQRFCTNHETRITNHGLFFALGARRAAQSETAVRTTAPAGKPLFPSSPLFTIVHYCSPLFRKKYCPAPVPRRQFFLERTKTRLWFSRNTNHETRNTAFFRITALIPCPLLPTIARYCPALLGGKYCPAPVSSCRPVAAFQRVVERQGRLWRGMGGLRPPHRQHGLLGFHESRDTNYATWFFPVPPATPRRATPSPTNRFFHESRDTRHETRLFCFSRCFPSRCGAAWAAMARHGRPPSPAPATRPVRFSRITAFMLFTSHESRNMVFPCPSGDFKESNPKPNQPVFHESRDTRHETRLFCFPTHHFPPFPVISRHYSAPPTPNRSRVRPPSTVLGKPQDERRSPPLPPPSGLLPAAAKER